MTQIFANRPELMPAGETTEEHRQWREEEALLVEKDRCTPGPNGGLFRGCFKIGSWLDRRRPYTQPIRDVEDGVDRCPRCTWELEDGLCQSCGYPSGDEADRSTDSDGYDFSPDQLHDDEEDLDSETLEALAEGRYIHPIDFSEHDDFMSDDGSYSGQFHHDEDVGPEHYSPAHGNYPTSANGSFYANSSEGTSYANEEDHSLDGFVVNDEEEGSHLTSSPARSIHWASDDDGGTNIRYGQDGGTLESDSDAVIFRGPASPASQFSAEEDSDGDPMPPSRRRRGRIASTSSASSGEPRSRPWQTRPPTHMSNRPQGQSSMSYRSRPYRSNVIDSDSDEPIPPSHRPRRRQARRQIPSSHGSGSDSSSGTATVGHSSPRVQSAHTQDHEVIDADYYASSPLLEESDDTSRNSLGRKSTRQSSIARLEDTNKAQPVDMGTPSDNEIHHTRCIDSNTDGPRQGSRQTATRADRRQLSPRPSHSPDDSPAPDTSRSPTSFAHNRSAQRSRDRRAQKAERKVERRRIKAEQEQRRRGITGHQQS